MFYFLSNHTDARTKMTNICALHLLLFFGWIPCTGWLDDFLAQLSDRIHHFTAYNLMPLAFLTKLSNMHWMGIYCGKMVHPVWYWARTFRPATAKYAAKLTNVCHFSGIYVVTKESGIHSTWDSFIDCTWVRKKLKEIKEFKEIKWIISLCTCVVSWVSECAVSFVVRAPFVFRFVTRQTFVQIVVWLPGAGLLRGHRFLLLSIFCGRLAVNRQNRHLNTRENPRQLRLFPIKAIKVKEQ